MDCFKENNIEEPKELKDIKTLFCTEATKFAVVMKCVEEKAKTANIDTKAESEKTKKVRGNW